MNISVKIWRSANILFPSQTPKCNKSTYKDKENGRRKESQVGTYTIGDRGSSFRKVGMKMNLEQEKTSQQSTNFKS